MGASSQLLTGLLARGCARGGEGALFSFSFSLDTVPNKGDGGSTRCLLVTELVGRGAIVAAVVSTGEGLVVTDDLPSLQISQTR